MSLRKRIDVASEAYRAAELLGGSASLDRLRARDIRRFGRGLLLHPDSDLDTDVYADLCLAFAQVLSDESFVSRRSAAALYGIPCPKPSGGRVDVGALYPARAPRRPQVLAHRARRGVLEWRTVNGAVLPSPADVWCQLASVLTYRQLVVAGDFLISGSRIVGGGGRRTPALATIDEIEAAHKRHRGATGSALRSRTVGMLRAPVDSPPESELRLLIVEAGFEEPVVNCPVPVIGRVLHADLGYPDLKIAIEYEGDYHFDDPDMRRRDARRLERMRAAGWRVLRVMKEDLRNPAEFVQRLASTILAVRAATR